MRKPLRLIASDLDGTLFYGARERTGITEENLNAIRRWIQAGNRFVLATGRPASIRTELFEKYQIDCDIIACNGAKVILDGEVLWNREIQPQLLKELCVLCDPYREEMDFVLDMDCKERITFNRHSFYEAMYPTQNFDRLVSDYLSQNQPMYPNKIFMILRDASRREFFMKLFTDHFSGRLTVTTSGPNFVEMSVKGCSKSSALKSLLERLDLTVDQAAAIGDEQNDLDMLHLIPYSFAMTSAREEIREQVPFSVDSVAGLIDYCLQYNAECSVQDE